MCTFILLYKLLKDYPVIALHNRYLGLDTLEKPPQGMDYGIFCPIDVASKGTWIGINNDGLLLAITNQETQRLKNPGRSRGLLALDILRDFSSSFEAKESLLNTEVKKLYRSGNFVLADKDTAWHVIWDREVVAWEIKAGPYAVGVVTIIPEIRMNVCDPILLSDSEKRRKRALNLLKNYNPKTVQDAISKIMQVSSDHEYGKTTASICWHSTEFKQTSSTIIALGDPAFFYYCKGNHCENVFKNYFPQF
jgi:uncharacterized protein with NRDE domain